jgi:hypothetical protein
VENISRAYPTFSGARCRAAGKDVDGKNVPALPMIENQAALGALRVLFER